MYFTEGKDRAFETLMRQKPGADRYVKQGNAPMADCHTCTFFRPDRKQRCVYPCCPYR